MLRMKRQKRKFSEWNFRMGIIAPTCTSLLQQNKRVWKRRTARVPDHWGRWEQGNMDERHPAQVKPATSTHHQDSPNSRKQEIDQVGQNGASSEEKDLYASWSHSGWVTDRRSVVQRPRFWDRVCWGAESTLPQVSATKGSWYFDLWPLTFDVQFCGLIEEELVSQTWPSLVWLERLGTSPYIV